MDNYPDNVRYPGDTRDPRSPFYEEPGCPQCQQVLTDCDCCPKCGQTQEHCKIDGECDPEDQDEGGYKDGTG